MMKHKKIKKMKPKMRIKKQIIMMEEKDLIFYFVFLDYLLVKETILLYKISRTGISLQIKLVK